MSLTHSASYGDLSYADLINANLSYADLINANLSSTNLSSANVGGVTIGATTFASVDLSQTKGLDTVLHIGPSSIGTDTLRLSKGKIPDIFLRGCGEPEQWISYYPALIGSLSPIDYYSCFISYNHEDKSFARRLHNDLQAKGIRCWLDDKDIPIGGDIYEHVDRGLRVFDKVLLCASESSLNSPWVEREIDTAIEREMELNKQRGEKVLSLIPLNLDGYLFKWKGSHAAPLRKRLAADFTGWETDNAKFEEQFERVVKALRPDEGGRENDANRVSTSSRASKSSWRSSKRSCTTSTSSGELNATNAES